MLRRPSLQRRRGAVVVESAFAYPVALFLIFSLIVGGLGVFRYQETAALAREGARYGSTHGAQFRKDASLPVGTADDWKADLYQSAIAPKLIALDPKYLTCDVRWPDVINQPGKPDNWPGSKVTVTISYQWLPEVFPAGIINLTSTSSMPITN